MIINESDISFDELLNYNLFELVDGQTLLMKASEYNNTAIINLLIHIFEKKYESVNFPEGYFIDVDANGDSALMLALRNNSSISIINKLLTFYDEKSIIKTNKNGETPLHILCLNMVDETIFDSTDKTVFIKNYLKDVKFEGSVDIETTDISTYSQFYKFIQQLIFNPIISKNTNIVNIKDKDDNIPQTICAERKLCWEIIYDLIKIKDNGDVFNKYGLNPYLYEIMNCSDLFVREMTETKTLNIDIFCERIKLIFDKTGNFSILLKPCDEPYIKKFVSNSLKFYKLAIDIIANIPQSILINNNEIIQYIIRILRDNTYIPKNKCEIYNYCFNSFLSNKLLFEHIVDVNIDCFITQYEEKEYINKMLIHIQNEDTIIEKLNNIGENIKDTQQQYYIKCLKLCIAFNKFYVFKGIITTWKIDEKTQLLIIKNQPLQKKLKNDFKAIMSELKKKLVGEKPTEILGEKKSDDKIDTKSAVGEIYTKSAVGEIYTKSTVGEIDTKSAVGEIDAKSDVGEIYTKSTVGEIDTKSAVGEIDAKSDVGEIVKESEHDKNIRDKLKIQVQTCLTKIDGNSIQKSSLNDQLKSLDKPLNDEQIKPSIELIKNKLFLDDIDDNLFRMIFTNGRLMSKKIPELYIEYKDIIEEINKHVSSLKKDFLIKKSINNENNFNSDNFEYYGDIIIDAIINADAMSFIMSPKNIKITNIEKIKNIYTDYYKKNSVFYCLFYRSRAVNNDIYNLAKFGSIILPLAGNWYKITDSKHYTEMFGDYFEAVVYVKYLSLYSKTKNFDSVKIGMIEWLDKFLVYKNTKNKITEWLTHFNKTKSTPSDYIINRILNTRYKNCGISLIPV